MADYGVDNKRGVPIESKRQSPIALRVKAELWQDFAIALGRAGRNYPPGTVFIFKLLRR